MFEFSTQTLLYGVLPWSVGEFVIDARLQNDVRGLEIQMSLSRPRRSRLRPKTA